MQLDYSKSQQQDMIRKTGLQKKAHYMYCMWMLMQSWARLWHTVKVFPRYRSLNVTSTST